jgi:hypothetical protein
MKAALNSKRYLSNNRKAAHHLDLACKSLQLCYMYAGDQHQQLGVHDLLNRCVSLRSDVLSLHSVSVSQLAASQTRESGGEA